MLRLLVGAGVLAGLLLAGCGEGEGGAGNPGGAAADGGLDGDSGGGTPDGGRPGDGARDDMGDSPPPDDGGRPRTDGEVEEDEPPIPGPEEFECPVGGAAPPEGTDWGAAPAGDDVETITCFEVRNDLAVERAGEVAFSGVPIPRALDLRTTDGLAVVGPGGRRVPAQFEPLARWGGPLSDANRPIRWLEISLPVHLPADGLNGYALVRAPDLPAPAGGLGLTVRETGGAYVVDTGAATFTVHPDRPGLLQAVELPAIGAVYRHADGDGAGPRLVLGDGTVIDGSAASDGELVVDRFTVLRRGPVRAVFAVEGHFRGPRASTVCTAAEDAGDYESVGYTLVMTFAAGQPTADLQFNFRNECGDNFFGPWTDNAIRVREVSYVLPVAPGGEAMRWYAGGGEVRTAAGDAVVVEQRLGGGEPWTRRARVTVDGAEVEAGEAFASPFVAVTGATASVAAQMGWMRYREPQALAAEGTAVQVRFVSEPLVVGEARGIWNFARLTFGGPVDAGALETVRARGLAAVERGLLVRARRDRINAAGVWPSLGTGADSTLKTIYVDLMTALHEQTVGPQWEQSKTYGSQLWPDIPFNPAPVPDPSLNGVEMNYWNGTRNELLEFMRVGHPKWAWDWALPQTWTQLFAAYSNTGENDAGNRNGFALISGGCGWENGCCHDAVDNPPRCAEVEDPVVDFCICDETEQEQCCPVDDQDPLGHWNRSNFGSDDYTYTHGNIAYVVRPNYPLLRRFAQAGRTAVGRYVDTQENRELFVNARALQRQVVQHWALLANCAEFVPGAEGRACHDKLMSILEEVVRDNLSAGVLCQRDDPAVSEWSDDFDPRLCLVPQQFMQNALMLPFFHRLLRNYGDVGGALRRAVVEAPWNYYRYGMGIPPDERPADFDDPRRPAIPTADTAVWTNQLQYRLTADRSAVEDCDWAPVDGHQYDDEGRQIHCAVNGGTNLDRFPPDYIEDIMLYPNRPHTVAMLLMAHELEPRLRVCEIAKRALNDPTFLDFWAEYIIEPAGWLKGPAQMLQGMVFGVGIADTCSD